MQNNIIADNTAGNWGGWAYFYGTTPTTVKMVNNTISENEARSGSGFVASSHMDEGVTTVDITNSIIRGNRGNNDIMIYELDSSTSGSDSTTEVKARYSDLGRVIIGSRPFYFRRAPYMDYEGDLRCPGFTTTDCCDIGADEFIASQLNLPAISSLLLFD